MRPFVYVNMAMTVDGKITSAGRELPALTSDHDRDEMDRLRAEADALLVGAGTLRADDPPLHVRSEAMQAYRRSLGKPARPRLGGIPRLSAKLLTSSSRPPGRAGRARPP